MREVDTMGREVREAAGAEVGAFTVETLALRCGCSPKTIRKNLRRVPGMFRVGRAIRFDRGACERRLLSGELLSPDSAKAQTCA